MSCTKAAQTFNWKEVNQFLPDRGVTLISAGLDEVPMVYKDILKNNSAIFCWAKRA
jgi:tRNA-splicing ligase RtcB